MTYCTVSTISKITGENWVNNDESGIITELISVAFNQVKALVLRSGLTPPTSDETLSSAEIQFVMAGLIRRGRFTGRRAKAGSNPDTYDSINRAIKMHTDMAKEFVQAYIDGTGSGAVHASDTAGQPRADLTGENFKLDQSTTSGF